MTEPASEAAAAPARPARWPQVVRTVHLWASLFGLTLLLFFALTGFVLHHADWFGLGKTVTDEVEGTLEARLDPLDDLALVEELRARFGVAGALRELRADPDEVTLRFVRPGEDTDVTVTVATRGVRVSRERGRLHDALTDLHKGERSGAAGALLVDAASLLLLVVSVTGLALWLAMPKRRKAGLIAIGLSLAGLFLLGVAIFS